MDKLLTLEETAKYLRVSERTIMRYLKSGKLKASKVGRWRIQEKDLKLFFDTNSNLHRFKKYEKRKNSKVKPERKFDPRNSLNSLNGAEWKFSTKSVISKVFPINMQHKLRSQHGGQKPPELCADLIKTFTKSGQLVLDPLAGVGGTLLGASLCGREAIGIEINPRWKKIYKKVCKLENLKEHKMIIGDARKELPKILKGIVDFILTDVPYWNMDKLSQTRSKKAKKSKLSKFNGHREQTKEEWLEEMTSIFKKCSDPLKMGGYMAVFVGDMYRGKKYHILSAELADTISKIDGLILKANLIWFDNSKMLHVYGYPHAFVPSMIHQNILIFRKEEKQL